MIYIYTLSHPITNGVRYVGKTDNLKRRYSVHTTSLSHKSRTCNWIKSLKAQGLKPIMELLDEVNIENWELIEQYWISQFKAWGFRLTNHTSGGDGNNGITPPHTQTQEWRNHCSKLHKGKVVSQVTKDQISNSLTGKRHLESTKKIMSSKAIKRRADNRTFILHAFKNNIFHGTYTKAIDLASELGCVKSSVLNVITGRAKTVKGLIIHRINCVK